MRKKKTYGKIFTLMYMYVRAGEVDTKRSTRSQMDGRSSVMQKDQRISGPATGENIQITACGGQTRIDKSDLFLQSQLAAVQ
jgi:hypothetical protein